METCVSCYIQDVRNKNKKKKMLVFEIGILIQESTPVEKEPPLQIHPDSTVQLD